ncbi:MAG: hypothetical protein R3246_11500, partial [Acidimicrobiia bacterium]|nr:hypothetical protein [Acidimicrobiia bacterium]
ALGMTFTSISSSTGGNVGIDLQSTTGSFTVAGDGGGSNNGSGGSIHTKTGNAIFLSNATNVSLNRMNLGQAGALSNVGDNCIRADQVNGLTVTRTNFLNCANEPAVAPPDDEAALFATSPTGTWLIDNVVMDRSHQDHLRVENDNGTLTLLTVTNSQFSDNNDSGVGDDAILYQGDNGSMGTIVIQSNTFEDSDGDHVQVALNGTASANTTIGGPALANGNTMRVNGGELVIGSGITLSSGQGAGATNFSGTHTFLIQNNDIDGADAGSINVNLSFFSTAGQRYTGTISDNTIGATGVGGSGGFGGIQLTTNGAGTATVVVENNQVRNWDGDSALRLTARDGSNRLNVTVRDNIFLEPTVSGTTETAIEVASGAVAGDTTVICLDLTDAAVDSMGDNNFDVPTDPTFGDMFFGTLQGGSVLLAGYTGAADDFGACPSNTITCHIQSANVGTPSVTDFTFGGSVSGAAANACQ